jgi:hypothetical protein
MNREELVKKIVEKKEFLEFPESIILKTLELKNIKNLDEKSKIKEVRAILRKYFSVFLTNKIVKGKLSSQELLKKHISSKERDYKELYKRILKDEKSVIDLGAGVNGLSYEFMLERPRYLALEASKSLTRIMNEYFKKNQFGAVAFHEDLFNLNRILEILKSEEKPRIVFMFNIIDALEFLERDYSKKLILELSKNSEKIVLSFPTKSLTGKKFEAKRYWILNFLEKEFEILDDFEMFGERFIVFRNEKS